MNPYERAQKETLLARLAEPPNRLIVVSGPRQTGKTTLVQQTLAQLGRPYRFLAVDEPEVDAFASVAPIHSTNLTGEDTSVETPLQSPDSFTPRKDGRWLTRHWEEARIEANRSDNGFVLVFDEIQKIPDWSEVAKGLWDADRRQGRTLHIILLGSAPLLMQRGLSESLAGRYETIRLTHWSFAEMSAAFDFDLDSYLYFGGYPGAAPLIHDQDRWRDYIVGSLVEPNIERDILALQRVDKPALLKRLFEFGAEYSGQILSYNKMLGQMQDAGNTTTLARYLDLLSRVGLVAGLSKYYSHGHRQRGSSPKFNVLNTALMAAFSGYTFEEARADRSYWGRLVESAAGAHLYNSGTPELRLHYWREQSREVDFVLERGRQLVAFEIKNRSRRRALSGVIEFKKQFASARSILVGEGGISLSEFLTIPAREWFQDS